MSTESVFLSFDCSRARPYTPTPSPPPSWGRQPACRRAPPCEKIPNTTLPRRRGRAGWGRSPTLRRRSSRTPMASPTLTLLRRRGRDGRSERSPIFSGGSGWGVLGARCWRSGRQFDQLRRHPLARDAQPAERDRQGEAARAGAAGVDEEHAVLLPPGGTVGMTGDDDAEPGRQGVAIERGEIV